MKDFFDTWKFKILVAVAVFLVGIMAYAGANGRLTAAPQELLSVAQPRLGSKAAAVPSTLNSEFSSKSLLNSPEVSACAVLLGALSLLTLDGSEAEELAWEASPFGN